MSVSPPYPRNAGATAPIWLAVALGLATTAAAVAQDELTVLPEPAGRMLYDSQMGRVREHLDARREAVAALKTPEDVRRRQEKLRGAFIDALGGLPEKTPLNARVVRRDRRDGYRVERVIFESRPDHHVTAVLYLPEGEGPFPGVLVPCGHSANGKAAETYQRASILMVKNGLAVLCYDPIGQGERLQILDEAGKPKNVGSTTEHSLAGVGALLVGQSAATFRIWDGLRAMDYLASRPEVDPARLGCTGNSGGGTLTAYLMALDDRIAVAAPSCYITSLERLFDTIGPQDAEQNITGQVAFGMDHADYIFLRAPKPTLICVGTRDFFDIDGAWSTFREAKGIYGLLGHGERVDLFEFNDPHGFSMPRRQAAMRWMRRWLLREDDAPVEGGFSIASDADLQCTESGQVLTDFRGKSVFDIVGARAEELAKARKGRKSEQGLADRLEAIKQQIALKSPSAEKAPVKELGEVTQPGRRIRKLVFQTEPGIAVPALLATPDRVEEGSPLVVAVGADRAKAFGPEGLVSKWNARGHRVLLADLRGMGETTPPNAPNANNPRSYFGGDAKEVFLAIHLNRPLLGQRVFDLIRVLDAMEDEARSGFQLVGIGTGGPIALHAAALDPRVGALTMEESIVSWTDVAQTPITRDQFSNVVPGALEVYDLPELAAGLAPRPLTIVASVDPAQKPLAKAAVDRAYDDVRRSYRSADAEDKLTIRVEP